MYSTGLLRFLEKYPHHAAGTNTAVHDAAAASNLASLSSLRMNHTHNSASSVAGSTHANMSTPPRSRNKPGSLVAKAREAAATSPISALQQLKARVAPDSDRMSMTSDMSFASRASFGARK